MPLFTVLLPITRGPAMLPCAIESVLDQTLRDFELCVICDGAPAETAACAENYARRDPRVQVFVHTKGERHGEAYRHEVLSRSKARYVAHIADDDLWFPDHLTEMGMLLSAADFGNLTFTNVLRDGSLWVLHGDLAVAETRKQMLADTNNFMGLSHTGYRLEAYRNLPEGWTPAPPGVPTDLYMWRKFLAAESLRCVTRFAITSLSFPAPARADETLQQRAGENRDWLARIRDPQRRDAIVQVAWQSLVDRIVWKDTQVAATASSCMHLDGELRQMTKSRAEYQAELARMTASRDDYIGYLGLMTGLRDDYQVQLGLMTASRDDYQVQLGLMTASRENYRIELDRLTRSKSWRLTAPLRALMALARCGQ